MKKTPLLSIISQYPLAVTLVLASLIIIAEPILGRLSFSDQFALMGNDDLMRLAVVRDLIAGQSWFDTTQYRIVPPDGVPLHWSRYIDAGIAAIIIPLSWMVEMETAERLATVIWPTLIMLVTLFTVAFCTRKIFGTIAAVFASLCLVTWPLTARLHSSVGNLDHHNVQLLLVFMFIFALLWPTRSFRSGMFAGFCCAFSLAIGLENFLFIVVVGAILVVQNARGSLNARHHLTGFCLALSIGTIAFWLGQTAPDARFAKVCDQLALPLICMVWVAALSSLTPLAYHKVATGFAAVTITMVCVVIGLVVLWPVIGTCFSSPYGNLPTDLQTYISENISEARSIIEYTRISPTITIIYTAPIIASLIFGSVLLWKIRGTKYAEPLAILLIFGIIGFAVTFYQIRTIIMAAAIVPMIAGLVLSDRLEIYLKERDMGQGLTMIVMFVFFIAPTLVAQISKPLLPAASQTLTPSLAECQTYKSLQSLNAVPPGLVFTWGNFGPRLIWATHHDALGAPYHRSAAALRNGTLAFEMEEAEFRRYIEGTAADYLLLCGNATYPSNFLTDVAGGKDFDWLKPEPLSNENLLLFAVVQK